MSGPEAYHLKEIYDNGTTRAALVDAGVDLNQFLSPTNQWVTISIRSSGNNTKMMQHCTARFLQSG
eukprot:11758203-Prorocentrum_lima.AAC.1